MHKYSASTQCPFPLSQPRQTTSSPEACESEESFNHYTVGWICARQEEYECACRMLDHEFDGPDVSEGHDDNTYTYGCIGKHLVVVTCFPDGQSGITLAARVARDMVRTFPNLRFALLVGIGGGVPTAKSDVRLGDVIVSVPSNGIGGVIQYDAGKYTADGGFQRTGQLKSPPERLLGAIPQMRRLYNDRRKPDRLAEHMNRVDDISRPSLDHLYKPGYEHVSGRGCENCDSEQILPRPDRHIRRAIAVHYGIIASGSSIMQDACIREGFANNPDMDVLCFETEAAGIMNSLDCLIVRGISHYCDSHGNDDWNAYASLTAAAYARELLLVLKPRRGDAMQFNVSGKLPVNDSQVSRISRQGQDSDGFANLGNDLEARDHINGFCPVHNRNRLGHIQRGGQLTKALVDTTPFPNSAN